MEQDSTGNPKSIAPLSSRHGASQGPAPPNGHGAGAGQERRSTDPAWRAAPPFTHPISWSAWATGFLGRSHAPRGLGLFLNSTTAQGPGLLPLPHFCWCLSVTVTPSRAKSPHPSVRACAYRWIVPRRCGHDQRAVCARNAIEIPMLTTAHRSSMAGSSRHPRQPTCRLPSSPPRINNSTDRPIDRPTGAAPVA